MSKKKTDPDFYKRMLEFKRLKKLELERKQLHDQFGDLPPPPNIVVKTEAEQKMDAAFEQLRAKLMPKPDTTKQDKLREAIDKIREQSQGL